MEILGAASTTHVITHVLGLHKLYDGDVHGSAFYEDAIFIANILRKTDKNNYLDTTSVVYCFREFHDPVVATCN